MFPPSKVTIRIILHLFISSFHCIVKHLETLYQVLYQCHVLLLSSLPLCGDCWVAVELECEEHSLGQLPLVDFKGQDSEENREVCFLNHSMS